VPPELEKPVDDDQTGEKEQDPESEEA